MVFIKWTCVFRQIFTFPIHCTAHNTLVSLALVHISMMQWNLQCSWVLPHKGVGRWFFSRFPAKIVSLTSFYSHWRHQLASSFVTQSIHTSLSLLKPAENPLSFLLAPWPWGCLVIMFLRNESGEYFYTASICFTLYFIPCPGYISESLLAGFVWEEFSLRCRGRRIQDGGQWM